MLNREDIVEEARKYLGVKWRHQGRSELGMDCAGLVIRVLNDLDLISYETKSYPRQTFNNKFLQHFREAGLVETALPRAQTGDVLVMREGNFACHCGFLSFGRSTTFVHAYAKRRRVVEEVFGDYYRSRTVAVFSPREE